MWPINIKYLNYFGTWRTWRLNVAPAHDILFPFKWAASTLQKWDVKFHWISSSFDGCRLKHSWMFSGESGLLSNGIRRPTFALEKCYQTSWRGTIINTASNIILTEGTDHYSLSWPQTENTRAREQNWNTFSTQLLVKGGLWKRNNISNNI